MKEINKVTWNEQNKPTNQTTWRHSNEVTATSGQGARKGSWKKKKATGQRPERWEAIERLKDSRQRPRQAFQPVSFANTALLEGKQGQSTMKQQFPRRLSRLQETPVPGPRQTCINRQTLQWTSVKLSLLFIKLAFRLFLLYLFTSLYCLQN